MMQLNLTGRGTADDEKDRTSAAEQGLINRHNRPKQADLEAGDNLRDLFWEQNLQPDQCPDVLPLAQSVLNNSASPRDGGKTPMYYMYSIHLLAMMTPLRASR